jgi:membrane protease subunit (stomatin/prohibitin family)
MAWARPRQATTSLRWSCKRCYTVNAIDAQFCSDCGLAPQGGVVAAASGTAIDTARTRLIAVPIALVAVAALALVGMQLIR